MTLTRPLPPTPIAVSTRSSPGLFRDLLTLTKPGITASNTLMAGVGLVLGTSASHPASAVLAPTLVGTALVVAAASTFNMVLERETDALMERTRSRPVAAQRIAVGCAWAFGAVLAALGLLLLGAFTNAAATATATFGLVGYSFIYTPLKQRTPFALHIGALPGATPPLIGVLAVDVSAFATGLALMALLYAWQFPHFLAISMRRERDYDRAAIATWSVMRGHTSTRRLAVVTAWALPLLGIVLAVAASMTAAGSALTVAIGLYVAMATLRKPWISATFFATLVYLPGLMAVVALDVFLR